MRTDRIAFDELLRHPSIWKHARRSDDNACIPTGFADLDAVLPGGGWHSGTLTELLTSHEGIGELTLMMPLMAHLSRNEQWLVCISPPYVPYAPALMSYGIDLSRFLVVHVPSLNEAFWAAEQALRSTECGAVLLWWSEDEMQKSRSNPHRNLRRLQLAAETGKSFGLVFRSLAFAKQTSPAALRLRLSPAPEGLSIEVLKCRGIASARPVTVRFAESRGDASQ